MKRLFFLDSLMSSMWMVLSQISLVSTNFVMRDWKLSSTEKNVEQSTQKERWFYAEYDLETTVTYGSHHTCVTLLKSLSWIFETRNLDT